MLKNLDKKNIQTTPFVAIVSQTVSNTVDRDLLLLEGTGSIALANEFIDWTESGSPTGSLNRKHSLALEQYHGNAISGERYQQQDDSAIYQEGQQKEGLFFPESEEQNPDGTYKRMVYNQVKNAFYNTYQDPTKMFGLENIDFPLSKVRRHVSDKFRVFTIPKIEFGEKVLENSVQLIDNSLNDNFTIIDDGNENLIAKENLFSKIQEIRHFDNDIQPGHSGYCPFNPSTSGI